MAPNNNQMLATLHDEDFPSTMNDYIKGEKIGEGNFSRVFEGKVRADINKECALKIVKLLEVDESTVKLQQEEVDFLRRLVHPNIVKYYRHFNEGTNFVIVMEKMGDDNMEEYVQNILLADYKLLPEYEIWGYYVQVADAVAFMHSRNIVHRDLKTANVLKRDKLVKLSDFGLSGNYADGKQLIEKCGTPFYMSPERVQRLPYGFKSDVWGLGCILYEMCTGISPFFGERCNQYSLTNKIKDADFPPLAESCYSRFLRELLYCVMQKEPEHRPTAAFVATYARKVHARFVQLHPSGP
ncbi:unnamed protein product [Bursaphelenchus okinawaensis]|uniref:non-specific serine/threonine protein kinase n=1 Tax=Bursaphelenchus okinawaensis TaxID=465554 RepID=A0A811KPL7_9BILA|nr:unnamed protein product [Bursaphelenchus okinawaensis]CAG9110350.1 unnamed protein product [Bursaphelenchus okinawaensis]